MTEQLAAVIALFGNVWLVVGFLMHESANPARMDPECPESCRPRHVERLDRFNARMGAERAVSLRFIVAASIAAMFVIAIGDWNR